MAELYRFFASSGSDTRQYSQADWAEVIAGLTGDGVISGVDDKLQVVPTNPPSMAVVVRSGAAWIRGYWYRNTTPKQISLQPAHATLPRIDRIVLRLDFYVNRKIEATVKTGTPASQPQPPALQQDANYWEISLARVYVAPGATQITSSNITDEREFVAQVRRIVISPNNPPSGAGMDGDIWFKYET
jgi:hypothetical protein